MRLEFTTKTITEGDCLMTSGMLFEDLARAYLKDFRQCCKVFSGITKISLLEACLGS